MKNFLLIIALLFSGYGISQSDVYLHFIPKVGGITVSPSDLGSTVYYDLNGVAFEINDLSYYISQLKLTHDGGQEINFDTPDDVKLVSVLNNVFNLGSHTITSLEQVDFGVGVPQVWNHLDINTYPSGHPLGNQQNPVMHWGWTVGYFHMALTAMGDDNADDICDQGFDTHCLGDANFQTESLIMTGQLDQGTNIYHIYIDCNVDEWIFGVDPGTTGIVHSETGAVVTVMNNVSTREVFAASSIVGLNENHAEIGRAYFSNTESELKITWKEMNGIADYQLIDMNGKVIHEAEVHSASSSVVIGDIKSGAYIFNCYNADGKRIHSMNLIH